jgi:hypothetical protein
VSLLLYLAPFLVLLACLILGRYPGEGLIASAFLGTRARPRAALRSPRVPLVSGPHGGALVAMALAGRGPPRRSAAAIGGAATERFFLRKETR